MSEDRVTRRGKAGKCIGFGERAAKCDQLVKRGRIWCKDCEALRVVKISADFANILKQFAGQCERDNDVHTEAMDGTSN